MKISQRWDTILYACVVKTPDASGSLTAVDGLDLPTQTWDLAYALRSANAYIRLDEAAPAGTRRPRGSTLEVVRRDERRHSAAPHVVLRLTKLRDERWR